MSFLRVFSTLHKPITRLSTNGRFFSGSSTNLSSPKTMACGLEDSRKLCILPNDTPVCLLDSFEAFEALNKQERRYAHHVAKASFEGALTVFLQVSPESAGLFSVFYHLFKAEDIAKLRDKAILNVGWKEEEWNAFLVYVAGFYANSGNYKSFGDSKIIPGVSAKKIGKLLRVSAAASAYPKIMNIWSKVEGRIDSLTSCQMQLGFGCNGVTCYHSENVTKEDSDLIGRFFKAQKGIEAWNTRLVKDAQKRDGKTVYRVLLASAQKGEAKEYEFEGNVVVVERGDYAPLMARTSEHLKKAIGAAANTNQTQMLQKYIEHFDSGNITDHKDGSRFWIKDKDPAVESYIGFIENYRDPAGTRSEFQGFVSCVNKETSKKFQMLVDRAESILKRLPWGPAHEKDKFLTPDFTALDVIAFAASGIPSGINIPNYDEIRQNEGFKNVSLANVISANPKQKMNFVSEEDEELLFKHYKDSFEVQVGLHELLGHGSGKLFQRKEDGTFNFDRNTTDLNSGNPVSSWYEPGETWSSKFGALSSAYEECRAEAVGYYLCCDEDILEIFGFTGELAQKVKYVNWLNEMRAGLLALEFYQPEQEKWGQAHSYARWVLTRVCMEAGQGFITIEEVSGEDGEPDLRFEVDKNLIDTVGKPAVGKFLAKLQGYKSTGDFAGGKALFESYGAVGEDAIRWRRICLNRRKPRRLFVQPNTILKDNGDVEMISYPASPAGIIQSFLERYDAKIIEELEQCWQQDQKYFPSAYPKA